MKSDQTKQKETLLVIVLGFMVLYLILDRDWMLYVSLAAGIPGLVSATLNRWIHYGWISLGEKLGFIVSKIVLGTLFIVILLPTAILSRLFRKDPLNLRSPKSSEFHLRDRLYQAEDLRDMW